jgi:hypothetical protein
MSQHRDGLTNSGKKEERQFNQILNKAVKEGRLEEDGRPKEVEARTTPRQHKPDGSTK